ncbi:hypothetical protein HAX54_012026 [Datura stramonium]|uniref:Uncharacterized protein n=1 Tax=Datura stramonium TaxID=4076 RepID=A0ABS8TJ49_DATST|nr:hypothetical protein [Datura stramonium]
MGIKHNCFSVINGTSFMYVGDEYGTTSALKLAIFSESYCNCHIRSMEFSFWCHCIISEEAFI